MPPKEDPLWQVTNHQHPQDPTRSGYSSKLRSNANISHKFKRPFADPGLIAQIRFRRLGIGQSSVTGTFGVTGPAIQRTNIRDFLKRVDSLEASPERNRGGTCSDGDSLAKTPRWEGHLHNISYASLKLHNFLEAQLPQHWTMVWITKNSCSQIQDKIVYPCRRRKKNWVLRLNRFV